MPDGELYKDWLKSHGEEILPASLEILQRGTYVALLVVQGVSLLLAVDVLVVATGGRLGYAAAPGRTFTDTMEG